MSLHVGAERTPTPVTKPVRRGSVGLARALAEAPAPKGAERVLAQGFWSSPDASEPAPLVDLALARRAT